MSLVVRLKGATNQTTVDGTGALRVENRNIPPNEARDVLIPFRQYLKNSSDSSDMLVDGSSTNVDFYVEASSSSDIYIATLSFVIADASQTLSEFGNLGAALTNGCQLLWQTTERTVTIHDALKTNFDFIRLCGGEPAFGGGTASTEFRATNVISTSEGYLPMLSFTKTFGLPWGIRLRKGTTQRLTLRVRDNVSTIDEFDCIAYGVERLPDDRDDD